MHRNLRSFLELLRRERDIVAVEAEVDPYLELAEIHRRVIERQGPALLFRKVKGSAYPVVTNLFGTVKRIVSYHHTTETPPHLEETFEKMLKQGWQLQNQDSRKALYSLTTGIFTRKQIHTITFVKN